MSFNKIIIVGNLGRNPELRYTPQGNAVCDFSVAVNERRKDAQGEIQEETIWFRVSCWGRSAEVASQFLTKGRQVYVEGRLRAHEWTDQEGRTRTSLDVSATELHLLGNRPEDAQNASAKAASAQSGAVVSPDDISEDSIPF